MTAAFAPCLSCARRRCAAPPPRLSRASRTETACVRKPPHLLVRHIQTQKPGPLRQRTRVGTMTGETATRPIRTGAAPRLPPEAGIDLTRPLRFTRPKTITVPAVPCPRLSLSEPPKVASNTFNWPIKGRAQMLNMDTAGPHQTIEPLPRRSTDQTVKMLPARRLAQYKQIHQPIHDSTRQPDRAHTIVQLNCHCKPGISADHRSTCSDASRHNPGRARTARRGKRPGRAVALPLPLPHFLSVAASA